MITAQLLGHDGRQLPLSLEPAFTLWPRLKGLLGRSRLAPATGLWIAPCNSVHCFFMRFAIDLLYLNSQQRVIAVRHTLKPWSLSLCWPARSVIELAAGECQRLGIQPGDIVQCEHYR
ncbi:DUF192 domain-containing protein [Ectopseudomonas mendocina]|uniref:DUF192 domain-containing protein n=1 Tax=Ectopseudomonas mendocina TaxID=300 RepID=UPI0023EDE46B|nr:DUF192 domain-containing protein [Pseudomonas mendocina]